MIARYDWGGAIPLEWDHENRLVRIGNDTQGGNNPPPEPPPGPYRVYLPFVTNNPVLEKYTYDGAGNRVKKYTRDATTYYIAPHYEVTVSGGQTKITKYYAFNGQRVAMRLPDGSLKYLHADHLGSTVAATVIFRPIMGHEFSPTWARCFHPSWSIRFSPKLVHE